MMQPKVIFWDLGDTLVEIRPELVKDTVSRILCLPSHTFTNPSNLDQCVAEFKRAVRAEWESRKQEDFQWVQDDRTEYEYWEEFHTALLRRLGFKAPPRELVKLLADRVSNPSSWVCFPDAAEALTRLSVSGIEMGIISNAFPSARKILAHLNLDRFFNCVILSYETPHAKPSRGIYEYALRCAQVNPVDALFVDDRPRFVKGAWAVGMRAFLLDREDLYPNQNGWRLHDLREVASLNRSGEQFERRVHTA